MLIFDSPGRRRGAGVAGVVGVESEEEQADGVDR